MNSPVISASVARRGKEEGERGSDAWGLRVRGGASGHALRDGRGSRAKRRGPRGAGEADRAGRGVGLSGREAGRAGRGCAGVGPATGLLAREWVGPRGGGPRGKAGSARAREKEKELGWARLLGFGQGSLFLFHSISFLFSISNSKQLKPI